MCTFMSSSNRNCESIVVVWVRSWNGMPCMYHDDFVSKHVYWTVLNCIIIGATSFCIPCKIKLPVYDIDPLSLSGGKYMHANQKRDIVCQSTSSAAVLSRLCHWGNKFLRGIATGEITFMVVDPYYVLADITVALSIVGNPLWIR